MNNLKDYFAEYRLPNFWTLLKLGSATHLVLFSFLLLTPQLAAQPGSIEWEQNYGGSDQDQVESIVETSDGGFAVAGWTSTFNNGDVGGNPLIILVSTGTWALIILISFILLITIVLLIYGIILFNRIVQKENRVDESKASIEAMLKKRSDLIPKLVDSVKEYMGYEESTLREVVELREETGKQDTVDQERMKKEDRISQDIKQIQVKAEDYPDLKASDNFKQLQGSLNEVEQQLSASRRFYNSSVKDYHDHIQMFPHSVIASMKNFREKEFFEANSDDKEDVNMKELF